MPVFKEYSTTLKKTFKVLETLKEKFKNIL